MSRLAFVLLLLTGCTAAEKPADDGIDTGEAADVTVDADPNSGSALRIELGSREEPFQPWPPSAEVIVIAGPQGGFHTDHAARIIGASNPALHLAVIWAEVWRDDLVLARNGWEFWEDQWEPVEAGFLVEIPALIFDDRPELGPAELRASLELRDGRAVDYTLDVNLVNPP